MNPTGDRSWLVRAVWALFAVLVCVYGFAVATEPLYQITSCEIINFDAACSNTLFAHYGSRLVAVVVCSVLLCSLPAIKPVRAVSWGTAVALTLGIVALSSIFSNSLFLYYVPVALVALFVAAFHRRLVIGPREGQVSDPALR